MRKPHIRAPNSQFLIPHTGIFLLALVVRLLVASYVFPPGHFLKYPALAAEIRAGDISRSTDGSFLYLSYHEWCHRIFGDDLRGAARLQLVLGSLAIVLLARIGHALFGGATAAIAGCVGAVYSGFVIYDSVFEPETLLMLLTLGWACSLLPDSNGRIGEKALVIGGVCYGMAVCTRPVALLALPFVILHLLKSTRSLRRLAAFFGPAALPLIIFVHQNWSATGRLTTVMMSPGQVFYEGNNPVARGALSAYPLVLKEQEVQYHGRSDYAHPLYRQIARSALGSNATIVECNDYWTGRSLNFMRLYPRAELGIMLEKLRFLFCSFEAHDVEQGAADEEALGSLPLPRFGVIAAFGLIGMLLVVRQERPARGFSSGIWLPYTLLACFGLTNLVFYVSARQRLHIVPYVILFAAVTVVELVRMLRGRRYRAATAWVVAIAITYLGIAQRPVTAVEMVRLREEARAAAQFYGGAARTADPSARAEYAAKAIATAPYLYDKLRPKGVTYDAAFYDRVVALSRSIVASAPRDMSLRLNAGMAEVLAGRYSAATRDLSVVADSGYPTYRYYLAPSSPFFYLGLCAEREGRMQEALDMYARALDSQPGCPWSLGRRAELLRRLGRTQEMAADLEILSSVHDPATVSLSLGMAAYDAGDYVESAQQLRRLIGILPDYRKARVFLMASLERLGDPSWRVEYEWLRRSDSSLAFPEAGYPR